MGFGDLLNGMFNPFAKGSPFSAVSDALNDPLGSWDKFKNGQTNDVNWAISQENLKYQRENLDYQKALQREIFEREDTANQRTVADLRAAGLNPLAMQGTNNAGEAIATEPLHNDYHHTDQGNLQALSQIFNTINQISATRNNASLQQSQANLINAQADNQRIKNLFEEDLLSKTIESKELQNIGQKFSNERSNIAWLNEQNNLNFNTMYGLTDNMPDIVKLSALMSGQKIINNEFVNHKERINTYGFGKGFTSYEGASNSNFLSAQQLKGALVENSIINGLLSLIPMGIGNLFKGSR